MAPHFISATFLLLSSVVFAEDCFDVDGKCQNDNLSCSGLYRSGLCPGASYIRCCVPDEKCLTKPGVCHLTSRYCSGSHSSGLCQGPAQRKCCIPSSSDSDCTNEGGMCKDDSLQCDGSYQSGLCSGGASRRCCIPGKTTNSEALATLSQHNIVVSSSGNCHDKTNPTCTSFDGLRKYSLTGIVNLKQLVGSSCDVTVTGGTETGHAEMQFSHSHGYKVDIRLEQCVTSYIESQFDYSGLRPGDNAPLYTDSAGNVYAKETNHWDILYY